MNLKRRVNSKGIRCVLFCTFELEVITGNLNGNTEELEPSGLEMYVSGPLHRRENEG